MHDKIQENKASFLHLKIQFAQINIFLLKLKVLFF